MTRTIGSLIAILLLIFTSKTYAQQNIIDQIIWVVGDEAILKSDVEHARIEMKASGQRMEGDPYCFIPEQLAMQKLFLDQAKIDSIIVSDNAVNRQIMEHERNMINEVAGGSKERLEEYFKAPMVELRERWREEARNGSMVQEVQGNIMRKTKALTPSDVRKYYNQLPQDSLPYIPTSVEVQLITTKPIVPLVETDRIKERLRDFRDRILSGETSFSTLAVLYSEDAASAAKGGEMPFMGRAEFLPEFANVAFALPDAEKVSNVVETEYGFHIVQLVERRGDRASFRHILLRPSIPEEEFGKSAIMLDSLRNDITAKKFSFEEAAQLSADKETRNNGGLMINQSSRSGITPRFAMEQLPAEVAKAIDQLQPKDISSPFRIINPAGQAFVAIAKLKERVEGHYANVSDDYQVLKDLVEEQKQEEELTNWLKKKINETYIRINTDWSDCKFKYDGWIKDAANK